MRRPDYTDIPEVFRRAMEGEGWQEQMASGGGESGDGRPPRTPFPAQRPWWLDRRVWLAILVILLFMSFDWLINTYTNWLWFIERGYETVWFRQRVFEVGVFAVAFLVASVILLGTWHTARRTAARLNNPGLATSLLHTNYTFRGITTAAALFFSFTFATAARSQWEQFLLFVYRVPYGEVEPIFGRDISFYLFELPVYSFVRAWFMPLLVFAVLGVLAMYALRYLPLLQGNNQLSTADVPLHLRRTLAVIGGIFFALWALGYYLAQFDLLYSPSGVVFGASYTDMNATLMALRVQMVAMAAVSVLFFYAYIQLKPRWITAGLTIWLAAVILLGGIYPALLQRFVVEPTELSREAEYIEHNIRFTRMAFGLDTVEVRPFGNVAPLTARDLDDNQAALNNIRVWDYRPLQQTYAQLQELRPYYQFSTIDIDRYNINGEVRQVMLAGRELNKANLPNATWVNEKLEFTHGYGVVMNPVDRFNEQGRPEFFLSDLPPRSTVAIEVERPQIYYGETMRDVVFVGSLRDEFSYPDDNQNVRTRYAGEGGVPLGGWFRRLAFALRFGETNLMFSEYITPETRVMFYRQIQERVWAITPFLQLDYDPYLVVADGRLVWIQDAYTVSNRFPYAEPIYNASFSGVYYGAVNYIRNSVKITIDAYDGTVTYYIVDEQDPILQSYHRAFPDLFQPLSDMPPSLQSHLRYPEQLFILQTRQYLLYHMTDVQTFYNQEDLRAIPQEIRNERQEAMEPYYVMFRLPGEPETEFLLIQPFTPADKPNMVAWIAARNDPAHYGELIAYEMPRQELVVGPIQIEGFINQEPDISEQFSLWGQGGSRVIRGNLIVIPLNNSFLYVEPIYLQSTTSALPELKRVIVASGQRIVMRPTLDEALFALVSREAPAVGEIEVIDPALEQEVEPSTSTPTPAPELPPTLADGSVSELIAQANAQFEAAQAAQRAGDWAAYGRHIQALEQTLRQLEALTSE